jgi:hypothetical protein
MTLGRHQRSLGSDLGVLGWMTVPLSTGCLSAVLSWEGGKEGGRKAASVPQFCIH